MSLMKNRIQKNVMLILLGVMIFTLTSCNKVTKNNYNKITIGMSKNDVILLLGNPTATYTNLASDEYLWLDKGNTFDDAVELVKKDKTVMYISIMFSLEFTDNKGQIVISKEYGNFKEKLYGGTK